MKGVLAFVLHAHLPFVYHPEADDFLEENWLFEAMTETYIPLLLMFERLRKDNIPFRLTLSLSPTLLAMLANPLLMHKYLRRIDRLLALAEKEDQRTKGDEQLSVLVFWYQDKLHKVKDAFVNKFQGSLIGAFKRLHDDGCLEIIGSTVTHGYLPLLQYGKGAVGLQIQAGLEVYKRIFQTKPVGFWLPECGYFKGADKLLADNGICYTILETHGLTRAKPSPAFGVYQPIEGEEGVFLFGRDPESARQVWSSECGYPADPLYRDFYRDIAYDLDRDSLSPYIYDFQPRCDSGFKYYKITGHSPQKEYYDPVKACCRAKEHAQDFVNKKIVQSKRLCSEMGKDAIFVMPFDAELFGHWWGEGIEWLEEVVRKSSMSPDKVTMMSLAECLDNSYGCCKAVPEPSSWGANGYNRIWLNENNEWVWRHLHRSMQELRRVVFNSNSNPSNKQKRAINQLCQELLLAQSSDWIFMIGGQTSPTYGHERVKSHILNVNRLLALIEKGQVDDEWLAMLESIHPPFENIDYYYFLEDI